MNPEGIVAGPDGALWFAPTGSQIGRITTAGQVSTYSTGSVGGNAYIAGGPDGALWFTAQGTNQIGRITTPVINAVTRRSAARTRLPRS